MLFDSLLFLVFFVVVFGLHRLPLTWTVRKANLLVASYLFYAAWNPPFVALLWLSTVMDFYVARLLAATRHRGRRRLLLLVTLGCNLGLLGYFKYGGFVLENFTVFVNALGIPYQPPQLDIILPVGISFYTFQTLSYTLDVYFLRSRPWNSFLDFALYVAFFPQLVAGPIVRAHDFLPQCEQPKRATGGELGLGLAMFAFGLFEKVVLADWLLAPAVDAVYGSPATAGSMDAWIGTLAFSGQIFFDFSGYSMCAIGVAMCLGFHLPRNFHSPYAAIGFSDFWRRWHISLSTWLRDYVYIPLGGNRRSESSAGVNVMFTMLVGGLWHGASWRFVVWGGLHGLYLVVERWLRGRARKTVGASALPLRILGAAATFVVVTVTWVFFRAGTLAEAMTLIGKMLRPSAGTIVDSGTAVTVSVVIVVAFAVQWLLRDIEFEAALERSPWWARSVALACVLLALLAAPGDDRAFIYFQF